MVVTKLTVGMVALVVFLLGGVASAQQKGIDIRDVEMKDFPTVSLTVSVPDPEGLDVDEIVVEEGGQPVSDWEFRSLTESSGSVAIVLAIDTSGSMQGTPLAAAQAAARQFIRSTPEEIKIGIVTFSDGASVALDITSDRQRALDVVDGLVAIGETAMYDAVVASVDLFAKNQQRNVVLLSDGGDTTSSSGLQAAIKASKDAEAAIYSVGLDTGEADVAALKSLSSKTEGRYSPAGTADLTAVYEGLATALSEQFVVAYESASEGGKELALSVTTPQGSDTVLVLAPKIKVASPAADPNPVEESDPLLQGTAGLIVVLALIFCSAAVLGLMLLGGRERNVRQRKLQRELANTTRGASPSEDGEEWTLVDWIPDSIVHAAEKVAARKGRAQKIELKLERAGWPIKPAEFLVLTGMASVAGFLLGLATMRNVIFALITAVVGGFAFQWFLSLKINRRLKKLQNQLPDILSILASSLRAGHSFLQALDTVAQEMDGAGGDEFARVVTEIRLGRAVDEALNDMAERVDSEDFKWAILAVNVQRNVGGNLAEVLDTVADTIRERETIRRQVDVLSAEGRLSIMILGSLPFLVAFYISVVNREYISLLFTTRIGIVMVVGASALLALGLLWMKKVVKIDV